MGSKIIKYSILFSSVLFSSETPATATERIYFETDAVHERYPEEIKITWDKYNLTSNLNTPVSISLYGYRETTIQPELVYIDILEVSNVQPGYCLTG
jgi:hypothetical protein